MTMFVRDEGQGPPVLLIHGLMASSHVFDAVVSAHAGSHRLIAVDLPGSGRSDAFAPMNPEALAIALHEQMKARGVDRYRVVGHSFGGLVALSLLASQPEAIESALVMSAPAVGLPEALLPLIGHPAAEYGASLIGRLPVVSQVVRAYVGGFLYGGSTLTPAQLDGYVRTLKHPRAWQTMLEAVRAVAGFKLPVTALQQRPLSLVWGERDRLVPVIAGERLAMATGAGFEVLPGVGHCVPEESPETVGCWLASPEGYRPAAERTRP